MAKKTSLIPENVQLVEREDLKSGAILNKSNQDLKFGVVYTAHPNASPDDFEAEDLLRAKALNPQSTQFPEEERTFSIVGGYFFERKDGNVAFTTRVFGVAMEAPFGITEGGDTIVGDNWLHIEGPSDDFLQERVDGQAPGWTFIVQEHREPRDKYPLTGQPMEIFVECPEIVGIEKEIKEETNTTITYLFTVNIDGPAPTAYVWSFDNGEDPITTTAPVLEKTFPKPSGEEIEITVTVTTQDEAGVCEPVSTQVICPIPPIACPALTEILKEETSRADKTVTIKFTVVHTEPKPSKFIWDFGGAAAPGETVNPTATRTFNRPLGEDTIVTVKVSSEGPEDDCQAEIETPCPIEKICPEITAIIPTAEDVSADPIGTTQTYQFALQGNLLTEDGISYEWNFGDGSPAVITTAPEVAHTYTRPDGDDATLNVTVKVVDTGDCDSQGEVPITLTGRCPIIKEFSCEEVGETEETITFKFTVTTEGPAPTGYTWDFGDGNTASTTVPEVEHPYTRPEGAAVNLTAKVTVNGPGQKCSAEDSCPVTVRGKCPVITDIICEGEVLELSHRYVFTVITSSPVPTNYRWEFGNGDVENTTVPTLTKDFPRLAGDAREMSLKVTIIGPEQECSHEETKTFPIEGICPEVTIDSIDVVAERTKVKVTIDVKTEKATPDGYNVDWGDGSILPAVLVQPPFMHEYARTPGEDKTYTATITAIGPDSCNSMVSTEISVEGYCPELDGDIEKLTELQTDELKVTLKIAFVDIVPDSCVIDWADGTTPEPIVPDQPISHQYARAASGDTTFNAKIICTGPGDCSAEYDCPIEVPGLCPVITNIQKEIVGQTDTELSVKFTAIFSGEKPTEFVWDFGDGTVQRGPDASVTHAFTRPEGDDETFTVKLTANGPNQCQSMDETECPVPGRCPVIINIQKQTLELTPATQKIKFTAILAGPNPDVYKWDFGDGTSVETAGAEVIHEYARPGGDDEVITITLVTEGPESCTATETTQCELEGVCPSVAKIELTKKAPDSLTQEVEVSLDIVGPSPDNYVWNWGDGSPDETTTTPTHAHVYTRPFGDDEVFNITVAVIGPENCRCDATTSVDIEGVCPAIDSLELTPVEPTGPKQTVIATVTTSGPPPTAYLWDCGDGKPPVRTTSPTHSCEYDRPAGDDETIAITVTVEGPGNCMCSKSEETTIKGICPAGTMGDISIINTDKTTQEVKANVIVTGPSPDKFIWDWGDGSPPLETLVPMASHIYQRPPGDDVDYAITVSLLGPDSCESSVGGVIRIKGVCPEITAIVPTIDPPTTDAQQVCITVTTDGPAPDSYDWDWGDGTVDSTTTPNACHIYTRPIGDDVDYMVKITVNGPGECNCVGTAMVRIEGVCPSIKKIIPSVEPPMPTQQTAKINLEVEGPMPNKFIWDWGDGSPISETNVPEAQHTYDRPEGDDVEYTVMVKLDGPGGCDCMASVLISISGICPEITELTCELGQAAEGLQPLTATVSYAGPTPTSFYWNWGDGSPIEETTDPTASHVYTQPAGIDKTYDIVVSLNGPGSCSHSFSKEIVIPKVCPEVADFKLTTDTPTDTSQTIHAEVIYTGPAPSSFMWHWGDGSPHETTAVPTASHTYDRPEGDDASYHVSVHIHGPGECSSDAEGEVEIKGICPVVTDISQTQVAIEPATQTMRIEVSYTGPAPDKFVWTIGTEPPIETNDPWIEHSFDRPSGEDVSYPIQVVLMGPCGCQTAASTEVTIDGICPHIHSITPSYAEAGESTQEVTITLDISEPLPTSIRWDWGDGHVETVNELTNTHVYDRPADADQAYTVVVTASGPGDCQCFASTQVNIPGSCPIVTGIIPQFGPISETHQDVTVNLLIDGRDDITYEWDWGDGSDPETTTVPTNTHSYPRGGGDVSYTLSVNLIGPGACRTEACLAINIQGTCPIISDIRLNYGEWDEYCQTIKFSVVTQQGAHDSYQWDWGDGSPIESGPETSRSHTFQRNTSEHASYSVTVIGKGPSENDEEDCDSCESSRTEEVLIPGSCPIIVDVKAIRGEAEPTSQQITFAAITRGPGPASYHWDIVGLAQAITETGSYTQIFERVASADRTYEVSLSIKGPDNGQSCEHSYTTSIIIPKAES